MFSDEEDAVLEEEEDPEMEVEETMETGINGKIRNVVVNVEKVKWRQGGQVGQGGQGGQGGQVGQGGQEESIGSPSAKTPKLEETRKKPASRKKELKEELASIFIEKAMPPTKASVHYLSEKSDHFIELWDAFSKMHKDEISAIHSLIMYKTLQQHSFEEKKIMWSAPTDEPIKKASLEDVYNLLEFFDNPEVITKDDVQIWVNHDKNFRKIFQIWCNEQETQDETKLFRKFKEMLQKKSLPAQLIQELRNNWPSTEKVNSETVKKAMASEKFKKAWDHLLRGHLQRGGDEKTTIENLRSIIRR